MSPNLICFEIITFLIDSKLSRFGKIIPAVIAAIPFSCPPIRGQYKRIISSLILTNLDLGAIISSLWLFSSKIGNLSFVRSIILYIAIPTSGFNKTISGCNPFKNGFIYNSHLSDVFFSKNSKTSMKYLGNAFVSTDFVTAITH